MHLHSWKNVPIPYSAAIRSKENERIGAIMMIFGWIFVVAHLIVPIWRAIG